MDNYGTLTRRSYRDETVRTLEPSYERRGGTVRRLQPDDEPEVAHQMNMEGEPDVAKLSWETKAPSTTVIKVLGVGGGGCNAVQGMVDQGFEGVEFYAINTDFQALQRCNIPNRIQIGENLTHGSGAGAIPSIGEQAAREAEPRLRELLTGADMVFITCGLGGGTGTGAAPVIAEIARSMNILNVAIVTKPFMFEGMQRKRRALEGYKKLSENVDTMIAILNDKLMEVVGPKTPLTEAFDVANQVLAQGIRAISDLIAVPGLINVDFRDVRTIMGETGGAVMGVGVGKGENRAVEAVRKACHSPLQEKIVIDGARGILINITGPPDVTMHEINEATSLVYEMADPEANVIFGVVIDNNMHDAMRVTIIATGFNGPDAPEGFDSTRTERLRPRTNPLTMPEPGTADDEDRAAREAKPAILAKREREGIMAKPQVDFRSPENPLSDWLKDDKSGEGKTESKIEIAEREAAREELAPVTVVPAAKAFSDSAPEEDQPTSDDPYYETPALKRRRRAHFFE